MHHLDSSSGDSMGKILSLLNKWGDDGIIVMSEKSLANLLNESASGSLRGPSGERIEVKRFDSAMLKQMAAEDDSHLLSRIENWMDTGRLAGAGLNGHIAFRENIANILGPEITFTVKNFHKTDPNADKSVAQQKVIQGRVESISEEEYDSVRKNVEALKQSLKPVETGQVDYQQSKRQETTAFSEGPRATEGKGRPSHAEHKKVEKKGKNTVHHASEATRQQEANKKRRQEEKKRVQKQKAKTLIAKENLDYRIDTEQTEQQKVKQERTKPK